MSALEQYKSIMDECGEPELPIELFRFFLSLALTGQDWLDVEQFIEGVSEQLAAALDDLEVAKNVANGNVEAKFDAWKQLDAMEHELDAALEACKAKDDIILEVLECESTTRPPIRLREALAIQPDDSALKDKAMTTYEQPKDWIERHLVEDPGGLLACEPSGLNEELKLARQANEFQHQTIKKQAAQIATMREFIARAPVSSGVCCCGEAIDGHSNPMSYGHTPVDLWGHSVEQILATRRQALEQFAEKVREQCAQVCESMSAIGFSTKQCANVIRALKELPK